jgi:DNA-binding response OmpR family regulator
MGKEANMSTPSDDGRRATPEQMRRKHVYVINGSPEFLDVIRELLQDEHYNVTTTNFVPTSFDAITVVQPDLLILDLVYGDRVGWDLLAALRQEATTRDQLILLVSTTQSLLDDAKAQHEAFGGDRYLTKPFDLDDLLAIIKEMIGTA